MSRYAHTSVDGYLLAIDGDGNVGFADEGKGSWAFTLGRVIKRGRVWRAYAHEDIESPACAQILYGTRKAALSDLLAAHGHYRRTPR